MKDLLRLLVIITISYPLSAILSSCSQDAYEKGEGEYSLMRGDFAEASVNSNKQIVSIMTDDGDQLPLKEGYKAKWIATADTTYRCILYYNKVKEKELKTDPIKFESIWLSRTGKYLNMSLLLMTGYTDDTTAVHKLSFVSDTLVTHPDSKHTLHFCLHHDQNGVPEYYTTQAYVSLLVDSIHADSIRFAVNTYNGPVVKTLSLRK